MKSAFTLEKMSSMLKRALVISCLFLATILNASAQGSPVSATVDRANVPLNQTLTLTITINESGGSRPSLPTIDGLRVIGTSTSNQISMINGEVSMRNSYIYTLQPTREGEVIIPPVTVVIGGQSYSTEPLVVNVLPATSSAGEQSGATGNPDTNSATERNELFVTAEVDNPNPYLGEQITYIFKYYHAVNVSAPEYTQPDFAGFWNPAEVDSKNYGEQVGDMVYRVAELRTILFPTVIGQQSIGSARLTFPGSLFQRGFELQTDPVTVNVRPLPEPMPENFRGAVGQFTLTANAKTESGASSQALNIQVDEPVTLLVELQGDGNFQTLPTMLLPSLPKWRAFDSTSTTESQVINGELVGTERVEQLLVPTEAGEFEIPAIEYTFFDPQSEQYRTVRTQAIAISVEGDGTASIWQSPQSDQPGSGVPVSPSVEVERLDTDIRHIKPVSAELAMVGPARAQQFSYWLLWLLPLALIVGDWGLERWQTLHAGDHAQIRRTNALRNAQRSLRRSEGDSSDPYGAASRILITYLSDVLDKPVSGMTTDLLMIHLDEQGLSPQLSEQVRAVLSISAVGQYAPLDSTAKSPDTLLKETGSLLKALDRALLNER